MKSNVMCLIICVFVMSLMNSCAPKKCKEFEYQKFGLDTTDFDKKVLYVRNDSEKDTLLLTQQDIHFVEQEEEISSFAVYMECENGVAADVLFNGVLLYEYYLMRNDQGYVFGLSSRCLGIQEIKKLNSISDVDMSINVQDSTCFLRSLVIEDGIVTSIVDSMGGKWILQR